MIPGLPTLFPDIGTTALTVYNDDDGSIQLTELSVRRGRMGGRNLQYMLILYGFYTTVETIFTKLCTCLFVCFQGSLNLKRKSAVMPGAQDAGCSKRGLSKPYLLVSATSLVHAITRPSGVFPGVLKLVCIIENE